MRGWYLIHKVRTKFVINILPSPTQSLFLILLCVSSLRTIRADFYIAKWICNVTRIPWIVIEIPEG